MRGRIVWYDAVAVNEDVTGYLGAPRHGGVFVKAGIVHLFLVGAGAKVAGRRAAILTGTDLSLHDQPFALVSAELLVGQVDLNPFAFGR